MAGIQMFSLEGKVALVTGSSKGLGKGMAAGLCAAGAHVVLNSRSQADCEAVQARNQRVRNKLRLRGRAGAQHAHAISARVTDMRNRR